MCSPKRLDLRAHTRVRPKVGQGTAPCLSLWRLGGAHPPQPHQHLSGPSAWRYAPAPLLHPRAYAPMPSCAGCALGLRRWTKG